MNNFKKVLAGGLVLSTLATTAGTVGCFADESLNTKKASKEYSFTENAYSGYNCTPNDLTYPTIDDETQSRPYQKILEAAPYYTDYVNTECTTNYPTIDDETQSRPYQKILEAAPYYADYVNTECTTNYPVINEYSDTNVPVIYEKFNRMNSNDKKDASTANEVDSTKNESTNDACSAAPVIFNKTNFNDKKDASTANEVDSTKKLSKLKKGLVITGAVAGAAAVAATGYAIYKGYIPTDGIKNAIAVVGNKGKELFSKKAEEKDICSIKEDSAPVYLPEDKPKMAKCIDKAKKMSIAVGNKGKEAGKTVVSEIVKAGKATGHGIVTAGKAVGNGVSKAGETVSNAGKAVGNGVLKVGKTVSNAGKAVRSGAKFIDRVADLIWKCRKPIAIGAGTVYVSKKVLNTARAIDDKCVKAVGRFKKFADIVKHPIKSAKDYIHPNKDTKDRSHPNKDTKDCSHPNKDAKDYIHPNKKPSTSKVELIMSLLNDLDKSEKECLKKALGNANSKN